MADPLSIASAVAGLISLGLEVSKLLHDQIDTIKDAPQDASKLVEKLEALTATIQHLDRFLNDHALLVTSSTSALMNQAALVRIADRCHVLLTKMKKRATLLTHGGSIDKAKGRLAWYYNKDKLAKTVEELQQFIQLFGQCETIDGISLLLKSAEELKLLNRLQQSALQTLDVSYKEALEQQTKDVENILRLMGSLSGIESDIAKLHDKLGDLKDDLELKDREAERKEILEWISHDGAKLRHHDVARKRTPGTGEWLLKDLQFSSWKTDATGGEPLWCHGPPGCGKSVLSSIVIDHLREDSKNISVAWFYCDYTNEDASQSVEMIISSLLRQLLDLHEDLPLPITSLYASHKKSNFLNPPPSRDDLCDLLSTIVGASPTKVFIVVDALDEYPDALRDTLLQSLWDTTSKARLMMTARDHIQVAHIFPTYKDVKISAHEDDLSAYCNSRLLAFPHITVRRKLDADPSLRDTIIKTVVKKAGGLFIAARLHMDTLLTLRIVTKLKLALNSLSDKLKDVYDATMERINHHLDADRMLALRILSLAIHVRRPFTVSEFQHALAFDGDAPKIDFEADEFLDYEDMLAVCHGLVIRDAASNTIRLVHYTAEEYFQTYKARDWPSADIEIAKMCVKCICLAAPHKAKQAEYILLEYAAKHWGDHANGDKGVALAILSDEAALKFQAELSYFSSQFPAHSKQVPSAYPTFGAWTPVWGVPPTHASLDYTGYPTLPGIATPWGPPPPGWGGGPPAGGFPPAGIPWGGWGHPAWAGAVTPYAMPQGYMPPPGQAGAPALYGAPSNWGAMTPYAPPGWAPPGWAPPPWAGTVAPGMPPPGWPGVAAPPNWTGAYTPWTAAPPVPGSTWWGVPPSLQKHPMNDTAPQPRTPEEIADPDTIYVNDLTGQGVNKGMGKEIVGGNSVNSSSSK